MADKLIPFMYQAWDDLDRAIDGLTLEEAATRHDVGSPIAWTVGHVTTQIDSWRPMREPILGYLRDDTGRGALWCYRDGDDGGPALVQCLPGAIRG